MDAVRRFALFVLFAIVLSSTFVCAQESDEDDDAPQAPTSTLALHYEKGGTVRVSFVSDHDLPEGNKLQGLLENALHCPPGGLAHPPQSAYPERYLQSFPANQREAVRRQLSRTRDRSWEGKCSEAMAASGLQLSTHVDLGGVLVELQKMGDQQLEVWLSFPESRYVEHTPSNDENAETSNSYRVHYEFHTGHPENAVLDLAFGYRPEDVKRALLTPALILLLPLLITFWMQRAALRGAADDPTAAWFSYFRVLSLCTTGTLLVWLCAWHVRDGIEEILTFRLPTHSVEAAVIRAAVMMLPPWIVCLICLTASHPVYTKVRGLTWPRGKFYLAQTLQVAVQAVPIMLLAAGGELLTVDSRYAMALLASVYFSFLVLARLRMKVTGTHPEVLTTGELRDRVFELARRAHTGLRQVLVMPAGRSQMANAFASRSQMVIFTDYLLARMNKREVLAVAAHEITHLQRNHIRWKLLGVILLIVSPLLVRGVITTGLELIRAAARAAGASSSQLFQIVNRIVKTPELDLLIFAIGLMLFYLQSRMIEDTADAGAVRLTGDPEALITALLKLGKLNLMPIQWGRLSGTLLTHPSTLKRVERIARIGQVAPERLQQIVAQYQAGKDATDPVAATETPLEDTFREAGLAGNRVVTTEKASQSAINKLFVVLFFHIAPALGWVWAVDRLPLHGVARLLALTAGIVVSVAIYAVIAHWTLVWGREKLQAGFAAKMQQEGLDLARQKAWLVGLAPDPLPRFYVTSYNWDHGYLFPASRRLGYVGDQTSFVLHPEEVRGVRLGMGVPGFFPVQRVYVDWWDDKRHELRTFNVVPMRPCKFWQMQGEVLALFSALQAWRANPAAAPTPAEKLMGLPSPAFGETTSRSIKSLHTFARAWALAFWLMILAWVACSVTQVPETVYVCAVVVLNRLYEHIPIWRWNEVVERPQPARAMAATVNEPQA